MDRLSQAREGRGHAPHQPHGNGHVARLDESGAIFGVRLRLDSDRTHSRPRQFSDARAKLGAQLAGARLMSAKQFRGERLATIFDG